MPRENKKEKNATAEEESDSAELGNENHGHKG